MVLSPEPNRDGHLVLPLSWKGAEHRLCIKRGWTARVRHQVERVVRLRTALSQDPLRLLIKETLEENRDTAVVDPVPIHTADQFLRVVDQRFRRPPQNSIDIAPHNQSPRLTERVLTGCRYPHGR